MPKDSKALQLSAALEAAANGSGWHFLIIPRKIGERIPTDGKSRRVVCTLNGVHSFQCALLPSEGRFVIIVNKKIRENLGIVSGDKIKVLLVPDESKYGLPMPAELREVLKQDPEGNTLFHKLTKGKQRSILWWIGKINDVDKRIQSALIFIEHLKDNDGKIVHDRLTEELKRPAI